jgi:serine/threonine-protein kinase RsbW
MKAELTVPSQLKFLSVVEHWLLESLRTEFGEQPNWPQIENRLRLVVVEVYTNIVRHAHRGQPDLPVLLRLDIHEGALALEIWDQGQGFRLDRYTAPDPQTRQEGGYGWLILSRLMDRVEYQLQVQGQYNCLRLEKDFAIAALSVSSC